MCREGISGLKSIWHYLLKLNIQTLPNISGLPSSMEMYIFGSLWLDGGIGLVLANELGVEVIRSLLCQSTEILIPDLSRIFITLWHSYCWHLRWWLFCWPRFLSDYNKQNFLQLTAKNIQHEWEINFCSFELLTIWRLLLQHRLLNLTDTCTTGDMKRTVHSTLLIVTLEINLNACPWKKNEQVVVYLLNGSFFNESKITSLICKNT